MRYAGDVFRTGRGRLRDRAISSTYFTISTPMWGGYTQQEGHLDNFRLGLENLMASGLEPRLIVDIGTGAGASGAMLARAWPQARVEAIDSSRRMVRHARSLHCEPNLRFRRASALALPYPDGAVDLVTCLNAFVVPSEMQRVCALGGHVLMAATWVGLREDDSDWVRRFAVAGFQRIVFGNHGNGSWELFVRNP
jgi:ubiquinone/menaquinone biosynthesis C-methylase UbiE